MRKWLTAAGVMIFIAGAAPLRAEELPWCTEFDPFTRNCAFASYNECSAAAKIAAVTCVHNPKYQPPSQPAQHKPSRDHR